MPIYPISKKDKREIIEDFLNHLEILGVVFAEESEDEKTGKITLDRFTGVKDAINGFLASTKKTSAAVDESDEEE